MWLFLKIILLALHFEDSFVFFFFFLNLNLIWFIFFKLNFFTTKEHQLSIDEINHDNTNPLISNTYFLNISRIFLLIFSLFFLALRGLNICFWWQHFKVSNLNLNLIIFILLFNFLILFTLKNLNFFKISAKIEYFFGLINIGVFLPLIFFINTLFTFLFILEFISLLIFYKFIVSKIWKILNFCNINIFKNFRNLPTYYLNMLFFQYWSTFFSSILIIFSFVMFIYFFGTTEWLVLNLLNFYTFNLNLFKFNKLILIFILLFGLLIKIGFTPIHFYKIETYKGLPFFAIFFYTTFYFLVFFLFFTLLILIYLDLFTSYWFYILFLFFFLGLFFVISLLFGVNYIKAFFAYSSVVNALSFILIVLSLLNF